MSGITSAVSMPELREATEQLREVYAQYLEVGFAEEFSHFSCVWKSEENLCCACKRDWESLAYRMPQGSCGYWCSLPPPVWLCMNDYWTLDSVKRLRVFREALYKIELIDWLTDHNAKVSHWYLALQPYRFSVRTLYKLPYDCFNQVTTWTPCLLDLF